MTNYDFSTLNCTDLEELVCELLNAEQSADSPVNYRTFKEGKDLGIDILYSTSESKYEHIGQVKHYLKTGLNGLLRDLKNKESIKVKSLAPNKYIFATSLALSIANCTTIKATFEPFLKDISDIYGQNDLNRLISKHNEIEKRNYKLWFSSNTVLESILNSELEFRSSSFIKNELIKRIRLYVVSPIFTKAREFLREKKFIIITGDPGTGKTTLAEMLLYEYIKEGFKLSFVIDNIHDAERELRNDESRQIIYFDDFLGSNFVEINKAKASEAKLVRMLTQIEKSENKYLILTTRSNLFSKAISESERLRHRNLRLNEKTLGLNYYNSNIKMQILINHINESDIEDRYKQKLNSNNIKKFISEHKNFSPRAIEFITNKHQVKRINENEYESFIRNTLDTPNNIWEHAYSEQTDDYEKILLQTILSFGGSENIDIVEKAFISRIEYETNTRNLIFKSHCWSSTFRKLIDGFVILKDETISFINPSLTDFLANHITKDSYECLHILTNIIHIKQFTNEITKRIIEVQHTLPKHLLDKLKNEHHTFLGNIYGNKELIQLAIIIYQYVDVENHTKIIKGLFEEIDDWSVLIIDYVINQSFSNLINNISQESELYIIIKKNISKILNDILLGIWNIKDTIYTLSRFKSNFELTDFVSERLEMHIKHLYQDEISETVSYIKKWLFAKGQEKSYKREIQKQISALNKFIRIEISLYEFEKINWYEVALKNRLKDNQAQFY